MSEDLHVEIRVNIQNLDALKALLDVLAERVVSPLGNVPQFSIPIREAGAGQGSYPDVAPLGALGGEDAGESTVHASSPAPKKKRGRPRKDSNVTDLVGSDLSDDSLVDDPLGVLPNNGPRDGDGVVDRNGPQLGELEDTRIIHGSGDVLADLGIDLTPAEKRAKGRQMLLALVASQPARSDECKALLGKYGVKTFAEVSDDRSAEFLADALLIVNSTPSAS